MSIRTLESLKKVVEMELQYNERCGAERNISDTRIFSIIDHEIRMEENILKKYKMVKSNQGLYLFKANPLYRIIKLLGCYNDMASLPMVNWPVDIPFSYKLLIKQAKRFNYEEAEILIDGEGEEKNRLVMDKNSLYFSTFLNQIFDGPLNPLFYEI